MNTLQLAAFPLLVCAPLFAQEPMPLVLEGDPIPGYGNVLNIESITVSEDGEWFVVVQTDSSNPDTDSVLLRNGVPYLVEGQALNDPPGSTIRGFRDVSINVAGSLAVHIDLVTAQGLSRTGIYLNDVLVGMKGGNVTASGITPGSTYGGFSDVWVNANDELLLFASLSDIAIPGNVETAVFRFPTVGVAETLAIDFAILPGQTVPVLEVFSGTSHHSALSDSGDVMYSVILEDFTLVLYRNNTPIAQGETPSPAAGRNWVSSSFRGLDMNASGDYVMRGSIDGDFNSNQLFVKNGVKYRQLGDTFATIAPDTIKTFGYSTSPSFVDVNGRVSWICHWTTDPSKNEAIFLDDEILVREGVTTVQGQVLAELAFGEHSFFATENGRYIIFQATLDDGRQGAFLLDLNLGTPYCSPLAANSTGTTGEIAATGFDLVTPSGSPLQLAASSLPPGQFGYFLASRTQTSIPGSGGSQGTLCLGGDLARFRAETTSTGRAGYLTISVDTLAIPTGQSVPILAGETWHFQCWHRDKNPADTSNLTDAISVSFQ